MSGMNKFSEKDRRRVRRRNHIARDLQEPKYHQRVVEDKKNKLTKKLINDEWDDEEVDG
jgi:hypothetical protein